MNERFRCVTLLALFTGCAAFFAAPAVAAGPIELKISHQWPANDVRDQMAWMFAKEVEKRTNGQIKFQIYPSASLFAPHQQFDAMASGALDMAIYPLTYSGGKLPATNLTHMPGLITNYKQAYGWRTAEIGKWLEKYLGDHGVKIVTWNWLTGGVASNADKPILAPADVKGLKARGPGKMTEVLLQAAGAAIASFPSTETYNAMQSRIVDALWTPSSSLISFRLYEVAKHVTTGQGYSFSFVFVPMLMSKATYDNKLTPEQQKIVTEVGLLVQKFAIDAAQKDDQRVAEVYGKAGVKVSQMNEQHFMEWRKLAQQSAWKVFAKQVKDGQKLLDMAQAVKIE